MFESINHLYIKNSSTMTNSIKQFNASIWKLKQEKNLSLKDSISIQEFPTDLLSFKDDLIHMNHLEVED